MPAELAVLLLLGHCVHLERNVLEPRLEALALPRHLADLVLDRLVLDEELTEGAPGSRERDGLLDAGPGHPRSLRGEEPPLVVEVVHDLLEPVADPADDILLGHLDVVELDVGGATGHTPMQSILLVVIPGEEFRSMSSMERPLCAEPGGPVRTATVK